MKSTNTLPRKAIAALVAVLMVFSLFGVVAAATEADPEPVAEIKLSKTIVRLRYSETAQLEASVDPAQALTWKSSNERVATVDENGLIEALTPGFAVVTVTTADEQVSAKCTVVVSYDHFDWFFLLVSYIIALFQRF